MTSKTLIGVVALTCASLHLAATTYYSRATGNWNSPSTWSLVAYGGTPASSYPGQLGTGDVVYISGVTVTVNAATPYTLGAITLTQVYNSGNDTRFLVSGSAITMTCTALQMQDNNVSNHMEIEVSSTATLQVNGSLNVTRTVLNTRARRMRVRVMNSGVLNVTGNFTYTFGRSGTMTENEIQLDNNGILNVSGTFTVLHGYTSGNSKVFDLQINNSAVMNCGAANLTLSNSNDGDDIVLDLNGGQWNVTGTYTATVASTAMASNTITTNIDGASMTTGSMTLSQNGGGTGDMFIYLNKNSTSLPALLTVNGTFTMMSTTGDDMELETNANSTVQINGNWTISVTATALSNTIYLDFNGGTVNVTGSMTAIAYNDNDLNWDIDGASVSVGGSLAFTQVGSSSGDMYLNLNSNTTTNASSLTAGGISLTDGGGANMDLMVYRNSIVTINGNLTYTLNNANGNDRMRFYMGSTSGTAAIVNVNGNVTTTLNGGLNANDEIFFDINGGTLTVTGNFSMTTAAGITAAVKSSMEIDNGNTTVTIGGTVALNHLGGSSTDLIDIGLNSGSPTFNAGALSLNHQYGTQTRFRLYNNTVAAISGNVSLLASVPAAALIDLNGNSTFKIGGSFIRAAAPVRYGSLTASPGTWVVYNGAATQTIAGDAGNGGDAFDYENIEIANTSSIAPQLLMTAAEGNVSIPSSGSLLFTDGIVASSGSAMFVLADGATSSSGNSGSFVDGPLKKVGNSPSSFVFPIGDGTTWARLGVSNYASYSGTTEFLAEYHRLPAPLNSVSNMLTGSGDDLSHVSYLEYWDLNRVYDVGNNATNYVTLYWQDQAASGIANASQLRVGVLNASNLWQSFGQGTISYGSSGYITTAVAVNTFGPLSFGSTGSGNSLPVKLMSFDARPEGSSVLLEWTTASETGSDYFTIERSADGITFESIGQVDAAGYSTEVTNYSATDHAPLSGISYYRLRQTDMDGHTETSDVVMVQRTVSNMTVSAFPNPAAGNILHVTVSDKAQGAKQVTLMNGVGMVITRQMLDGDAVTLDMNGLPAGVYFVAVNGEDTLETIKVIRP